MQPPVVRYSRACPSCRSAALLGGLQPEAKRGRSNRSGHSDGQYLLQSSSHGFVWPTLQHEHLGPVLLLPFPSAEPY